MPAVFVHGVPDTSGVWQGVLARLPRRDVVTLSLPGFGRPTPDGFDATKEAYVRWLLDELAAQPGPIDVVGHDWGGLLVVRAVSLARSAVNVGREWSGDLAHVTAPGLVRWGEGDPYAASRFGARLAERPDAVAAEVDRFWTHIRPGAPRDA